MSTASPKTKWMFLRLLLAAAAIILAHDALMAMDSHEASASADAHHEVVAQGCGSIEGNRSPEPVSADTSSEAAFLITSRILPLQGTLEQSGHQILTAASASKLRAMLQVFLN